jgi:hypothetical protein
MLSRSPPAAANESIAGARPIAEIACLQENAFARWNRGKMNPAISVVLVNSALAFVSAFAGILIIGALARYIGGAFTTDRASRIAAFGVAIGYVLGGSSHSGPVTVAGMPAISASLGAIAALVAAWAWLIRKRPGEMTEADD